MFLQICTWIAAIAIPLIHLHLLGVDPTALWLFGIPLGLVCLVVAAKTAS